MKAFALLLSLVLFAPAVIADGMGIDPYDYNIPSVGQNDQIVFIDYDGKGYTTSLHVSLDFKDYDKDKILWIVPFEEIPEDITFEEKSWEEFQKEYSYFDDSVDKAIIAQKAQDNLASEYVIGATLQYPVSSPVVMVIFDLSPYSWSASRSSHFGVEHTGGPGGRGIDLPPIRTFDFGEMGKAEVYKIGEESTLKAFFESKGVQAPQSFEKYLDSNIVIFEINKESENVEALVKFRFNNPDKIFYPSGTTELWETWPLDYFIKIRTPRSYSLDSNIDPDFQKSDFFNTYTVYTGHPTAYRTGYDYRRYELFDMKGFWIDDNGELIDLCEEGEEVVWRGENLCEKSRKERLRSYFEQEEIYTKDLHLQVKKEKTPVPLGMLFTSYIPKELLILPIFLLAWILAAAITVKHHKKDFKGIKKKGVIGLAIFFMLAVFLTGVISGTLLMTAVWILGTLGNQIGHPVNSIVIWLIIGAILLSLYLGPIVLVYNLINKKKIRDIASKLAGIKTNEKLNIRALETAIISVFTNILLIIIMISVLSLNV